MSRGFGADFAPGLRSVLKWTQGLCESTCCSPRGLRRQLWGSALEMCLSECPNPSHLTTLCSHHCLKGDLLSITIC